MGDKKAINNEKSLMQKIVLEIKILLKQILLYLIVMNWAERSENQFTEHMRRK